MKVLKSIRIFKVTALALMSSTVLAVSAKAEDSALSAAQKDAVKTLVKEYLMEEPKIVIDAMEAYRVQEEENQRKQAAEKIKEHSDFFKTGDLPSVGNKDGDVVVVEFFDYNCGYCKRALPDIQGILGKDKNVKVVLMEMPILGPTSLTAAQWALAAREQGKYFEYHTALMEFQGQKTEDSLTKIADDLGLDVDKMKADANGEKVQKQIDKAREIATDVGVRGTPAFIVGEQFFPGYIGEAGISAGIQATRAINEARKGK